MLPVAELHVHIEGTLEPELLVQLAERNGTWIATTDAGELPARYRFDCLQSFLELHYANLRVLRIEQDFYDLARAYLARAAAAGVRRAEIFFDPQTHLANGVPLAELFGGLTAALADGAAEHGISADLILCFLRHLGPEAADAMLRASLPFRDSFIGVGLDSTEVGHPPTLFKEVYEMAAAEGLRLVAHAGRRAVPSTCATHLTCSRGADRPRRAVHAGPRSGRQAARSAGPADRVPAVQRRAGRRRRAR